jgi:hypothetical protein
MSVTLSKTESARVNSSCWHLLIQTSSRLFSQLPRKWKGPTVESVGWRRNSVRYNCIYSPTTGRELPRTSGHTHGMHHLLLRRDLGKDKDRLDTPEARCEGTKKQQRPIIEASPQIMSSWFKTLVCHPLPAMPSLRLFPFPTLIHWLQTKLVLLRSLLSTLAPSAL